MYQHFMFSDEMIIAAGNVLQICRKARLRLASAESCTGGLIAAILTEVPGSSDVFERGFVTYSNDAKIQMLGVDAELISNFGAVSREVAEAMAQGALARSDADLSVAVTGIAGPGGGNAAKPVGLVHIAASRKAGGLVHKECRFGNKGRSGIRLMTVQSSLELIISIL